MPLTHSVSGDTRRKWTWSMGGGHRGKLNSLGTLGGGNRLETAGGMGACIHRVRNILFCMGANLVGGNRVAHLCGRVDPLMIVSQVPMGGDEPASLCEANGKRPSPPGGQVNTHTQGIAMGMSPAPTISNLYVSIFEAKHIL